MRSARAASGSSPLARGLRRGIGADRETYRIIPARAGFTWTVCPRSESMWDHPRSRGVYASEVAGVTRWARIIPARAGFTATTVIEIATAADHPRSRGVYHPAPPHVRRPEGSSPLARGLRDLSPAPARAGRIIPARAGFTLRSCVPLFLPADHPRSRGVYHRGCRDLSRQQGSSPLARGLPPRREPPIRSAGIIPARAGFTTPPASPSPFPRDHPRSRGVYTAHSRRRCVAPGSSPLARGLRPVPPGAGQCVGIIPARAGFTPVHGARGRAHADHPRSRGVYGSATPTKLRSRGSSPLARGLPSPHGASSFIPGIIPARAGFTVCKPKCHNMP